MSHQEWVRLAGAAAGVVILAFGSPAGAAEVSGTDTVPPGMVQIETSLTVLPDASGEQPVRDFLTSLSLRLGLAKNLDVGIDGDLLVEERSDGHGTSGLGDTTLTATWRLLDDQDWRPALGLVPFVKLPTASRSKELGSGRVDFGGIGRSGRIFPAPSTST